MMRRIRLRLRQWFDSKYLLIRSRKFFSASNWTARLLGLPYSETNGSEPGLIMIQIDGLSKTQLENAIFNGNMPFLRNLWDKQDYSLFRHYSGLPSATPSVQGELFYGVKQIVPSFSFYDKNSSQIMIMYDGDNANSIENILEQRGYGLLKDGSSYSNVYSGDAMESHFCAVSLGWNRIWKKIHPLKWAILIITQSYFLIRTTLLMIWEFFISTIDFVKGVIQEKDIWSEFKFIPIRIAICILLRDLIVMGAKIDISRGLPVIHMNFLGYDEQAHRRGPTSLFAHWALKGIDNAIAKIYRAALRSPMRHYDIWIYSDHGQEETLSYLAENKKTIQEAVSQSFSSMKLNFENMSLNDVRGIQLQRARYLGLGWIRKLFPQPSKIKNKKLDGLVVTAIGPIGHINLPEKFNEDKKNTFARLLVDDQHVPTVICAEPEGKISLWNKEGHFTLPDQAKDIFGADHPYLKEVTQDIISLSHHDFSGDFVLLGWQKNGPYYSFPLENGSHAGPGREETNAFILAPSDVISLPADRHHLYTDELRRAALKFLKKERDEEISTTVPENVTKNQEIDSIRIMSYNVHSCVGMDGKVSPRRIARVIARHEPDIVALQELDMYCLRTNGIDQPHEIARYLEMSYHFHPSIGVAEELYGNAILSRFPLRLVKAGPLPQPAGNPSQELRGALWVKILLNHRELNIINTHLGLNRDERLSQAKELTGPKWLTHPDCRGETILCGDLNALPNSPTCRTLESVLVNALEPGQQQRHRPTWMSQYPMGKIDHIFVTPEMRVKRVEVSRTDLDIMSSDHLPLIVDVILSPLKAQSPETQKGKRSGSGHTPSYKTSPRSPFFYRTFLSDRSP